ncbi:MAG: hypothetical protein NXI20_22135 [bacterium]|nr:hypothetical protein [bacterium]
MKYAILISAISLLFSGSSDLKPCVVMMKTHEFEAKDSNYASAKIEGFDNIIPHLNACDVDNKFSEIAKYETPAIELLVPAGFDNVSHHFGANNYSFVMSEYKADHGSFIHITYDITGKAQDILRSKFKSGKIEARIESYNGHNVYIYSSETFPSRAQVFLNDKVAVSFNTMDTEMTELLLNCITSIELKD